MRNRVFFGVAALISGGLTALGPRYIFKICDQAHGTHGGATTCFWTAQAEIGIGAVVAAIGLAYLLSSELRTRLGLSLAVVLMGFQALLVQNLLIGVCEHANMACRLATLPALNLTAAGTTLLATANAAYLAKTAGRGALLNA